MIGKTKKAFRVVLFLTEKCDKNCYYCDIGQIENQQDINKSFFYEYFDKINGRDDFFDWFTLTGGEPGLVDVDVLDYFFNNVCGCHKVRVNTNGLFITKGYFKKYYNKIDAVGLHPAIEVGDPDADELLKHVDCKIDIFQPVTGNNYHLLPEVLDKYPGNWVLIPLYSKGNDMSELFLTKDQFDYISNLPHKNIQRNSLDTMAKFATFSDHSVNNHRISCGNSNIHPTLDFVKGRILRCPVSRTHADSVELNSKNFELMLQFNLFPNAKDDCACLNCNDCLRYYEHYYNNVLYDFYNRVRS